MRRRVHPERVVLWGFGTSEGLEWGLWLAITVYWMVERDLSVGELVLLGVALEGTVLLSETPTGVVADLRSRRLSLVLSQILMGLSFAWTFASDSLWMLVASHALLGFAWTFQSGADAAWIHDELKGLSGSDGGDWESVDYSDSEIDQLLLKRSRIGMLLSLVIGPLTIALGWWQSVRFVGLILSAAFIAVGVWMAFVMTEDHFTPGKERNAGFVSTLREGSRVVKTRPRLRTLIAVAALLFAAAEFFGRIGYVHLLDSAGLVGLEGSGESLLVLGVLFFATALGGLALNTASGDRLERGDSVARVAGLLLIVAAVGGLLASATSVIALIGIGFVLQDGVQESMYPVFEGWANRDAPSEVRATVHSLVGQTISISQIVGALLIGGLAEATSVPVGLGVASACIGLSSVVALRSDREAPSAF